MCYESLIEGTATERPLSALLREELRAAVRNGVAAAAVVVAVSLTYGADPTATAGAALGAVVLGAVLHQAVLVVAVAAQRAWRRRVTTRDSTTRAGPNA